jgi:hypothetical protein
MIGVVINMLPSLLKNSVIAKQSKLIYQNNANPEPFARLARLKAAQRKNPMLSNTMDIIMVEMIVIAAPLTVPIMLYTSDKGTMPARKNNNAPIAVGMDSFIPRGLHTMKPIVAANTTKVKIRVPSNIRLRPRLIWVSKGHFQFGLKHPFGRDFFEIYRRF